MVVAVAASLSSAMTSNLTSVDRRMKAFLLGLVGPDEAPATYMLGLELRLGCLGDESRVARLFSKNSMAEIEPNKPYTELWMGTHESFPVPSLLHRSSLFLSPLGFFFATSIHSLLLSFLELALDRMSLMPKKHQRIVLLRLLPFVVFALRRILILAKIHCCLSLSCLPRPLLPSLPMTAPILCHQHLLFVTGFAETTSFPVPDLLHRPSLFLPPLGFFFATSIEWEAPNLDLSLPELLP